MGKTLDQIRSLDPWILAPLNALVTYGLRCGFPRNPDERAYYHAVHEFFEKARALEIPNRDRRKPGAPKVVHHSKQEYPTEEQMRELWEANKTGGAAAIAEVLRRRRLDEEQEEQEEPKPQLTEERALRAYAAMINTLDVSKLDPFLAENFHYASQWVFSEIESKSKFLGYISVKLQAIRKSGNQVWAEMGRVGAPYPGPCVIMAEGNLNNLISVVVAKVDGGKISRLDMCCVPSPEEAERTGFYPVV